jgi:hypothetical protein
VLLSGEGIFKTKHMELNQYIKMKQNIGKLVGSSLFTFVSAMLYKYVSLRQVRENSKKNTISEKPTIYVLNCLNQINQ